MKNKILYFASLGGEGSVNAVHIKNRARLFYKLGYDIGVISDFPKDKTTFRNSNELHYNYMKPYKFSGKLRGLLWWLDQVLGLESYVQIKKVILRENPEILIIYECNSVFLNYLLQKLCKRYNIKLAIEVSEWMDVKDFKFPFNIIVKQKDFQHRYLNKKNGNIITISDYLSQYYKNIYCNTVCLPPLFDVSMQLEDIARYKHPNCDAIIRLVFAGSLAQKDYLIPLIKAVLKINRLGLKIALDVIGPEKGQILQSLEISEIEKHGIFLHGRLPHDQTVDIVKQADFSVLLRENRQYAKAGVSTKFTEAMSLGVPSICTKVGGTDLFVNDGDNGFLIDDNNIVSLTNKINNILNMHGEEILEMKRNALKTAKDLFDISAYTTNINDFVKKLE